MKFTVQKAAQKPLPTLLSLLPGAPFRFPGEDAVWLRPWCESASKPGTCMTVPTLGSAEVLTRHGVGWSTRVEPLEWVSAEVREMQ